MATETSEVSRSSEDPLLDPPSTPNTDRISDIADDCAWWRGWPQATLGGALQTLSRLCNSSAEEAMWLLPPRRRAWFWWAGWPPRQMEQSLHPDLVISGDFYPSMLSGPVRGSFYVPAPLILPTTSCCCCSVTKSCPTLCNPMDYSPPGSPVLYHRLDFAQIHVHWVSDAI